MATVAREVKALLRENGTWKEFYTQRAKWQEKGKTREQIEGLLAGFIVACPGGRDYLDKDGLPIQSSKNLKKHSSDIDRSKAISMNDILTDEQVDELTSKPKPKPEEVVKWVSASFLRDPHSLDFTGAPSTDAITTYFAYRESPEKFYSQVVAKTLDFSNVNNLEEFDGANLSFFCCELRDMMDEAKIKATRHHKHLEDRRQAILNAV